MFSQKIHFNSIKNLQKFDFYTIFIKTKTIHKILTFNYLKL